MLYHATYSIALYCLNYGNVIGSWFHYIDPSIHYKDVFVFWGIEDNNKRRLYEGQKYIQMYPLN